MLISLFSLVGGGTGTLSATGNFMNTATFDGWYDYGGRLCVYENGTAVDDGGQMVGFITGEYKYYNSTGVYALYQYEAGEPITNYGTSFNIASSWGVIAIVVGLIVLAGIVGLNILGSGENSFSSKAIVIGTGLTALWSVFSLLSLDVLTEVSYFGVLIYFGLTCCFAVGAIQTLGGVD